MMRFKRRTPKCWTLGQALFALGFSTVMLPGCRSAGRGPILPAVSLPDALRLVNENAGAISTTLRATGNVDGHFTQNGRRRGFHADGVLFYLAPRYLRFDIKSLGQRRALFGSNDREYWFCEEEQGSCRCGAHSGYDELSAEMPARPVQIIEALGLGGVPAGSADSQKILEEYQQVLFTSSGDFEKEYWLDRAAPRLIRRVIFRDRDGSVRMESSLDDYRRLSPDGPWLPHTMTANWPATGAHLRFRISKWSLIDEVGPGSPQFAAPEECGNRPVTLRE